MPLKFYFVGNQKVEIKLGAVDAGPALDTDTKRKRLHKFLGLWDMVEKRDEGKLASNNPLTLSS